MANFIECVDSIAEKYGDIGFEGIIVLNEEGETEYEKRWIQDYPRDIYSNTKSIYQKDDTLKNIVRVLKEIDLTNILHKEFYDIKW